MDSYPAHLAPEFEDSGAVKTPFNEWWTRVDSAFSNVPEDVAREWLHRHWRHSPYGYLSSKNYTFAERQCPELKAIRTLWSDFNADNEGALRKGEELINMKPDWMPYVPKFMLKHRKFPAPIVVLDNRDGHHDQEYHNEGKLPREYILLEGHTRFNTGIYLQSVGKLDRADVWLMTRS